MSQTVSLPEGNHADLRHVSWSYLNVDFLGGPPSWFRNLAGPKTVPSFDPHSNYFP